MLEWRRPGEGDNTISRGGRILEVSFRPKYSQRSIASVQDPCWNRGGGGLGGGGGVEWGTD